jgi:predicted Zn-dependent protease
MSMPSDPAVYRGRLGDGRTAAAVDVAVRCGEAGLEIRPVAADRPPLLWRYGELRSGVPLRAGAPDTLLSHEPDGSHTVFVADPAFVRSLAARARHLAPRYQRLAGLRIGAAFVALVAAVTATIWSLDLRPLQSTARLLPQSVRELMGRNVVASLTGSMRVCETEAGRAALDRLTQRLVAVAADNPMPVRVTMINWPLPNAFAAPGGQLVLTRGLVQSATTADEVAGVLAHELGHAVELHPEVGIVRHVAFNLAANVVFAGSGTGNNIGVMLMTLRYSRDNEREADTHAVRILKGAGISPRGFGDFFERIDNLYGEKALQRMTPEQRKAQESFERALTVLSTHPATRERLAMVRAQPPYAATPALTDADWRALRQMCNLAPPGGVHARPPQR